MIGFGGAMERRRLEAVPPASLLGGIAWSQKSKTERALSFRLDSVRVVEIVSF